MRIFFKKTESSGPAFRICTVIAALAVFAVCSLTAYYLPTDGTAPDELLRRMIPFFIVNNHALPTGFELSLNAANPYGFSYASYPPFPALLSAFFIKAASFLTSNERLLIIASRLGSVIAGTAASVYLMRLGRLFFRKTLPSLLLVLIVCFMPQVIFINSYFNADSISLCSTIAILYYLKRGQQDGYSVSVCIKLAIAMSVSVLTYYNGYSWCLIAPVFCVITVLRNRDLSGSEKKRLILRRGLLIAGVVLVLTGWYFVRNYLLYEGDFLAIRIRDEIARDTAAQGYNINFCSPFSDRGYTLAQMLFSQNGWLSMTLKSLIGIFGGMNILMPEYVYGIFGVVMVIGLIFAVPGLFRDRENRLLYLLMLLASAITVGLSVWYSYHVDYQPQGRYIVTILPMLGIFIVSGYQRVGSRLSRGREGSGSPEAAVPVLSAAVGWGILVICIYACVISPKVLTHNELTYSFNAGSDECILSCTPAETEACDTVSFAVWRPEEDDPVWYSGEFNGTSWQICLNVPEGLPDGDYSVHIYSLAGNRSARKMKEGRFTVQDGTIRIFPG